MKAHYDILSQKMSLQTTRHYSTSFSLGIKMLDASLHGPIYSIYGWVRLADEIVDSFHGYEQRRLMAEFRKDSYTAIAEGISVNPIIHSFQQVVNEYQIEEHLYDTFLRSMEMDLEATDHTPESYAEYILGSAEVVGLMCLKIFVQGDTAQYEHLRSSAKSLGAAFQKVNFLRDLKADYEGLGRVYFPGVDFSSFDKENKLQIEREILQDFDDALVGIRQLPRSCRFGVYSAYMYYKSLYRNIKRTPAERVMQKRIRVPNWKKLCLTMFSYGKISLRMI